MLGTYLLRSMVAMTTWRDSLKGANSAILQELKVENQQLQSDLDHFKGIQEELQTSLTTSQAAIDSKTAEVAASKVELLKPKEESNRMRKDLDAAALARLALEEVCSLDQKKLFKLQEELNTLSNAREEKKELLEQISALEDAMLEGYQGEPEALRIASYVVENTWCEKGFTNQYKVVPCSFVERVCHAALPGEDDFIYMYEPVLRHLGVTLPFHSFEVEVLRTLGLSPLQLHPSGWAVIQAFRLACQLFCVVPTAPLLLHFYHTQ
ncbi:hypothetical protein CR513_08442, partial [Mucuna pruriens]